MAYATNEIQGTLTISVHVVKPAQYRGEKAERHHKVPIFREHALSRDEAMERAREFAAMNPDLKRADMFYEWQVRESLFVD